MGRRPDPPELQAAKGNPGKRPGKVARQIAKANEIAELLVGAPHDPNDRLAPPSLLDRPECADALAQWRELAPRLAKRNLFSETDRLEFAILCVYAAEFVEAHVDVKRNGYAKSVRTVSGDLMPRINPNVKRRDKAQAIILSLGEKFGLTPKDYYDVTGRQAQAPAGALFAQAGVAPPASAPAPAAEAAPQSQKPADDDPIGLLGMFDSPPPARPN